MTRQSRNLHKSFALCFQGASRLCRAEGCSFIQRDSWTWDIHEASMADCASSSRAVIAHMAPSTRPTACSVPVAFPAVNWKPHQTHCAPSLASGVQTSVMSSACMHACEDWLWPGACALLLPLVVQQTAPHLQHGLLGQSQHNTRGPTQDRNAASVASGALIGM